MNKITEALEGPDGFTTNFHLTDRDLSVVRGLIKAQWLQRIEEYDKNLVQRFADIEMDGYHEICHLLDHKVMWPKSKRILAHEAVTTLRQTSFIKSLEAQYGHFAISAEDEIEKEEVYWRLVRPNSPTDVGPLHADNWFWSLGHGKTPTNHTRVKVWMSIFSETGKNGFKFVRGSHLKDWRYHGEERDGFVKPLIDEDESALGAEIFQSQPGQAIIFHDKLLHGGAIGGKSTRVSLEFTMFVKNENYFN
jgi:hypothetical protein